MKFSRYIGDMSIDLEGEPEEIIQVLEYLDGGNYEDREVDFCIDEEKISRSLENATERVVSAINNIYKQNQGF